MKRNKRTAPPGAKVSSIPEFLAKQLLKQFGFPMHLAPGEAEAECALLQREGIVDVVLSEDVDTLMFGAGATMRNWSPEGKSSKVPTHVTVYDALKIKEEYGMDRDGMILVAMMSGGDYIPEGIPGCGPKVAVEAAKAGFGASLCKIGIKDMKSLKVWRDGLQLELRTNQSKHFKRKHSAIFLPDDWPSPEVLGYYTNPAVSSADQIRNLKQKFTWDLDIDFDALRSFTADAFDWQKLGGAKKFIRNLAPALVVRELRLRHERNQTNVHSIELMQTMEMDLVQKIHGKRNHHTTDNLTELRISFSPLKLVPIDLSLEEPDDTPVEADSEEDAIEHMSIQASQEGPLSPRKRGPSKYDPTHLDRIWVPETFLKLGVPLAVEDWQEHIRQPAFKRKQAEEIGQSGKQRSSRARPTKSKPSVQTNTIKNYGNVTKFGASATQSFERQKTSVPPGVSSISSLAQHSLSQNKACSDQTTGRETSQEYISSRPRKQVSVIEIFSSPNPEELPKFNAETVSHQEYLSPTVTTRSRRYGLKRSLTAPTTPLRVSKEDKSPIQFSISTCTPKSYLNLRAGSPSKTRSTSTAMKRAKTDTAHVQGSCPDSPGTGAFLDLMCLSTLNRSQRLAGLSGKSRENPINRTDCLDLTASPTPKPRPPPTISEWLRRSASVTPRQPHNKKEVVTEYLRPISQCDHSPGIELETFFGGGMQSLLRDNCFSHGQIHALDLTKASSPPPSGVASIQHKYSRLSRHFIRDDNSFLSAPTEIYPRPQRPVRLGNFNDEKNHAKYDQAVLSPQREAKRKQCYRIRESVDGTWDFVDLDLLTRLSTTYNGDELDESPKDGAGNSKTRKGKNRLRESEVMILDMTGD